MEDPGHVYSVSALTASLKAHVEGAFPFVWVRGQVGNVSRPSSGHVYFTLRDAECSLAAVWFKGRQRPGEAFDPLTGEVYEDGPRPSLAHSLENGQEIVCAGPLQVYGARGQYQLVVELAQEAGLGLLHERFARLCRKLEEAGYFAAARKRPLPASPERIAVVTAPTGAAIHDFARVAQGRGLGSRIRVFPAPVQGEGAPEKIRAALARIAEEGWAQLVVLIRGGGSLEDLWAFNDEQLARTIFTYPLPVLAGIGHEVDFTLADMTADVRAATPSHAAQLLWPDREELALRLGGLRAMLERAAKTGFERMAVRLDGLERTVAWRSPGARLSGLNERLDSALRLLVAAGRFALERHGARLDRAGRALDAVPGTLPARMGRLAALQRRLAPAFSGLTADRAARLGALEQRLVHAGTMRLTAAERLLERNALRLQAMDPHAPLERGYALVRKSDGTFVKATAETFGGERLRILLRDGELPVTVDGEKR